MEEILPPVGVFLKPFKLVGICFLAAPGVRIEKWREIVPGSTLNFE